MSYYPQASVVHPSAYSYVRSHGRHRRRYDNYYNHSQGAPMAPVQVVPSMVVGYNSLRLILDTQLFSSQTAWQSPWLVVYIFSYLTLSTQPFSRTAAWHRSPWLVVYIFPNLLLALSPSLGRLWLSCLSCLSLQPLFTRKSFPSLLRTCTCQCPVQVRPWHVGFHGLFPSTTIS